MKNSAEMVASMGAWIEGLTPETQVSADDVYRVQLNDPPAVLGPRDVRLGVQPGRQRFPGKNLSDWETMVEVRVLYPDVPTAPEEMTVQQVAVMDAEHILYELYRWSTLTPSVIRIEAELGQVNIDPGSGIIYSTRMVRVEYTRE